MGFCFWRKSWNRMHSMLEPMAQAETKNRKQDAMKTGSRSNVIMRCTLLGHLYISWCGCWTFHKVWNGNDLPFRTACHQQMSMLQHLRWKKPAHWKLKISLKLWYFLYRNFQIMFTFVPPHYGHLNQLVFFKNGEEREYSSSSSENADNDQRECLHKSSNDSSTVDFAISLLNHK